MSKERPLSPNDVSMWISEDISRGKGLIAENFCGYPVTPGRKAVDRLIAKVGDDGFDFSNEKFQKAVNMLKEEPKTKKDWLNLIDESSQCNGIKRELKSIISEAFDDRYQVRATSAKPSHNDGAFNYVQISGECNGQECSGLIGAEIDGRDAEVDITLADGTTITNPRDIDWEYFWENSVDIEQAFAAMPDVPKLGQNPESGEPRFVVETARGRRIPVWELAVGNRNDLIYLAMSPPGKYRGWVRAGFNHWDSRPREWNFGRIPGTNGRFYAQKYEDLITINPENIISVKYDGEPISLEDAVRMST